MAASWLPFIFAVMSMTSPRLCCRKWSIVIRLLKEILVRLGSLEVAQKHLDVVLKRVPDAVQVLRIKVEILVTQNAFEAEAAIAIGVSKLPDFEALGLELLASGRR